MGIFRNHNKRFKFYKYLFNRTVITLSNYKVILYSSKYYLLVYITIFMRNKIAHIINSQPRNFLMYGYAMNYKKDLQIVDYLQERGFEFLPLDKLGEAERILAWGYVHEAAQLIGEKTYKHYRDDHFLTPRGQYLQHKFGPISTECFDTLIKGDEVEIHTPEDGFTKYVGKYVRHKNGNSEHNDDNVGYVVLDIDGKKTKIRGDLVYEAINCKTGAALKKPSECFDRNEFSKYMTMFE